MNKYIEKIANKVELEPGVHYDLEKHDMKVSTKVIKGHLDAKDRQSRLLAGGVYGVLGTGAGTILGETQAQSMVDKSVDHLHVLPDRGANAGKSLSERAVQVPGKKNLYSLVKNKFHPLAFRRIGMGVGGLLGGTAGAGLGYALGGTQSFEKTRDKNKLIASLERKHEKTINQLEGWDN
jgi:hypothetical protein